MQEDFLHVPDFVTVPDFVPVTDFFLLVPDFLPAPDFLPVPDFVPVPNYFASLTIPIPELVLSSYPVPVPVPSAVIELLTSYSCLTGFHILKCDKFWAKKCLKMPIFNYFCFRVLSGLNFGIFRVRKIPRVGFSGSGKPDPSLFTNM